MKGNFFGIWLAIGVGVGVGVGIAVGLKKPRDRTKKIWTKIIMGAIGSVLL